MKIPFSFHLQIFVFMVVFALTVRPLDAKISDQQLLHRQFLLTRYNCRVMFCPAAKNKGRPWQYLSVEEGQYVDDEFKADRILNGDEAD